MPACLAVALQTFQLVSWHCNWCCSNTLWCWKHGFEFMACREQTKWRKSSHVDPHNCTEDTQINYKRGTATSWLEQMESPLASAGLSWNCSKVHCVPYANDFWWIFFFNPDNRSIILCLSSRSREHQGQAVGLLVASLNLLCSRICPCNNHVSWQSCSLIWWILEGELMMRLH